MHSIIAVDRAPEPVDRSTAVDGWLLLTEGNPELGHRYIEIMCRMNRATYATDRPDKVARRMAKYPCEYFYFPGEDFEVVCGFRWNRRRRLYRWVSVGFVGAITPQRATDLVAGRVRRFLRDKGVQRLVAVEPSVMDSRAILEFYRLTRQHPALVIRGSHRVAGGTYIWIEAPPDTVTSSKASADTDLKSLAEA